MRDAYTIEWANFDNGVRGVLVGSLDSVFQVYFHYLRNRQWHVLRLFYMHGPVGEVTPDGRTVAWWDGSLPIITEPNPRTS